MPHIAQRNKSSLLVRKTSILNVITGGGVTQAEGATSYLFHLHTLVQPEQFFLRSERKIPSAKFEPCLPENGMESTPLLHPTDVNSQHFDLSFLM